MDTLSPELLQPTEFSLNLPNLSTEILLNDWFIGGTSASMILAYLMLLGSLAGAGHIDKIPAPDPVQQQIQAAEQNLQKTLVEVSELRRRDDFNPINPTNYGDWQALIQQLALDINNTIAQQFSDPNHPNYQKNYNLVLQSVVANAMNLGEAGLAGKVSLIYELPDGQKKTIALRPVEVLLLTGAKLEAANLAQGGQITIPARLSEVQKNFAADQQKVKAAMVAKLTAQGQTDIANELENQDPWGYPIDPRMQIPYTP
ncbi:MAG: hypothetical protein IE914_08380 [Thiotrichales bacterium]|nr:hypothetical protein [Thiotrichales bacterium]